MAVRWIVTELFPSTYDNDKKKEKTMANEILKFDWARIDAACEAIAQGVVDAGLEIDMVIGISRGGLIPATIIAHQLGVQRVGSFQIGSYESGLQGAIQDLEDRNHLMASVERADNILIVEDIVDTGKSMKYLRDRFELFQAKIAFASLVVKGHKAPQNTWPDIYDTLLESDAWVHFPWEQLP